GCTLRCQFPDDRPARDDDGQEEYDAEDSLELEFEIQEQCDNHRKDQDDRYRDEGLDRVADQEFDKGRVGAQRAAVVRLFHEIQLDTAGGHRHFIDAVADCFDLWNEREQPKTHNPDQDKAISGQGLTCAKAEFAAERAAGGHGVCSTSTASFAPTVTAPWRYG